MDIMYNRVQQYALFLLKKKAIPSLSLHITGP